MVRYAALDGIRVLNSMFVMILHVSFFSSWFMKDPTEFRKLSNMNVSYHALWIMFGNYSVDAFFVLSGLLLAKSIHSRRMITLLDTVCFLLHRYLRIAVAYYLVSILFAGLGNPNCVSISELAFISLGFFNSSEKLCIQTGWSLQTDWQVYILISLLTYVLGKEKLRNVVKSLILLSIASRALVWITFSRPVLSAEFGIASMMENESIMENLSSMLGPPAFDYSNSLLRANDSIGIGFNSYYVSSLARAGPMLIGFELYHCIEKTSQKSNFFVLPVSLILLGFCALFNPFAYYPSLVLGAIWEILNRHLFACAMGGIIYATSRDPNCFLSRYLSLPIFSTLSRLTFPAYLIHSALAGVVWTSVPPTVTASAFGVAVNSFKIIVISYLLSIPLSSIEQNAQAFIK